MILSSYQETGQINGEAKNSGSYSLISLKFTTTTWANTVNKRISGNIASLFCKGNVKNKRM